MSISQIPVFIFYYLPLVFLFCAASLISQELQESSTQNQTNLQSTGAVALDGTVYIIRDIRYFINGRTKETALERMGAFNTGERFNGLEELNTYITEKMQVLNNIRPLEPDKNAITYTLGEAEPDGIIPVQLDVSVSDSINLIFFPVPKYDSNSGLELAVYLREYNFLGNLAPLRLDIFWKNDDNDRSSLGFEADFSIPFQLFTYNWTVSFFNEFLWYFNDNFAHNTSILDISMELPVSYTILTFGLEQGLVVREENTGKVAAFEDNSGDYHDYYLYTKPYILWYIPTPIEVGSFGQLVYTPGIYGIINYQLGGDVGDYRRGPGAGINQELGLEKINWQGNFRQGIKLSLNNNNEYNFFREEWIHSLGLEVHAHAAVNRLLGISSRFQYTKWFNDYYEEAGDVIRGYKDNELHARERLSINLDFPFRLIRFALSEWTGNRKLRYFDFEQHWSPFIDLLLVDTVDSSYQFTFQDLVVAAGLEIITFPLSWRSFYIRASIGWNMNQWFEQGRPPGGIHREIYIGTGHYY